MASAVRGPPDLVSPCEGVELPKVERTEMRFLTRPGWSRWPKPWTLASHRRCCWVALPRGELVNCSACSATRVDLLHRRVQVAEVITEVRWLACIRAAQTRAGRRLCLPAIGGRGLGRWLPTTAIVAAPSHARTARAGAGLPWRHQRTVADQRRRRVPILSGLEPALVVVLAAILLGEIVTLAVVLALGGLEVLAGRRAEPLGQHR